uniref:OR1 n=1 Tax=Hycleus cichorii TaxID=1270216 RepID=A0A2U9NJC1_9CUCU|nr:OR1 [Hycleus cichorii]AWT23256.1 OR6 [Hycleus cichorii]
MLITWKSVQFINLLFYFTAMLVQLWMYCWFGNEIILKSIQVGDACYNSKWYELDSKLIKNYVFLIMERCKRPIAISVYGLATLSLTSYVSILNWSYSYYALLRRLYAKTTD